MDELTLHAAVWGEAPAHSAVPLAHALTWTWIHCAWVGAFAALGLHAFLRLAREERSRLRYGASLAALASLPLVATWILVRELAGPSPASEVLCLPSIAATESPSGLLPAVLAWGDGLRARLCAPLEPLEPWIAGTWAVLAVAGIVRVAGGWCLVARFTRGDLRRAGPRVQARAARLGRRIGLCRRVGVHWSASAEVPMVVGALRPRIVIPARLRGALEQGLLDQVLLHELAHVRRGDAWAHLAEACLQALFLAHPAMHWISARVRREREHCCDDAALAAGADRLGYVRALAALEMSRPVSRRGAWLRGVAAVPALGATDGPLVERIRRLTASASRPRASRSLLACAGLLLGTGGLALGALPTRDPPPRFEIAFHPSEHVELRITEARAAHLRQGTRARRVLVTRVPHRGADLAPLFFATGEGEPARWRTVEVEGTVLPRGRAVMKLALPADGAWVSADLERVTVIR